MHVTFSQAAEMVLSRHKSFRESLLKAIEVMSVTMQCFIDARIGRTPANDELVLYCQNHPTITVPANEFEDAATIRDIIQQWSSTGPE